MASSGTHRFITPSHLLPVIPAHSILSLYSTPHAIRHLSWLSLQHRTKACLRTIKVSSLYLVIRWLIYPLIKLNALHYTGSGLGPLSYHPTHQLQPDISDLGIWWQWSTGGSYSEWLWLWWGGWRQREHHRGGVWQVNLTNMFSCVQATVMDCFRHIKKISGPLLPPHCQETFRWWRPMSIGHTRLVAKVSCIIFWILHTYSQIALYRKLFGDISNRTTEPSKMCVWRREQPIGW